MSRIKRVHGIYFIINKDDLKVYINGSFDLGKSIKDIISGKRYKDSKSLQFDIEKYGLSKFSISMIEVYDLTEENIDEYVEMYISEFINKNYEIYNFIKLEKKRKNIDKRFTEQFSIKQANNMSETMKGKIYIHNDNSQKLIYPEELEEYELNGWKKGTLNPRKIWMNNGTESIQIPCTEIDEYKSKGYICGKKIKNCYRSL